MEEREGNEIYMFYDGPPTANSKPHIGHVPVSYTHLFEMPGSLVIKKNVDWGNASDQTKQDKNEFKFDIEATVPTGESEATEPLTGNYHYYVGNSDTAAGHVMSLLHI